MSTNTPVNVQIYDPNDIGLTKRYCERLQDDIKREFGPVRIQTVSSEEISNSVPLLIICHNHSRIGTDINHSVSDLPQDLHPQQVAICVLHVQSPHALPVTMPTENLTSEEYEKYGMLVDFAFTTESGVYTCDMNNIGLNKLVSFLQRFLCKPAVAKSKWYNYFKQKVMNFGTKHLKVTTEDKPEQIGSFTPLAEHDEDFEFISDPCPTEQGESSTSSTIAAGSEDDFDVICDPCHTEGQRVQATGHCRDCNENLCVACIQVHRKMATLKGHDISNKSTLSYSQKCDISANRATEEKGQLKQDVSGGVTNSGELKQIQADLQLLLSRLTNIQHRTNLMKQTVDDSYTQIVTDIRSLKKKIIDTLDKLEEEILDRASLMKGEKITSLGRTISTCERMVEETGEIITDVEKKKSMSHNNRIHVLADSTNHEIYRWHCERLSFQQSEILGKLISTLTSIGSITSQTGYVMVKYQHEISVNSDTDTETCLLFRMNTLPDGRLALVDYKLVKLVDVTQRKVSEQISLGITHTKGQKLAVTVNRNRYIQVLSVSPTLSKCYTIAIPGRYTGIETSSEKFIAACSDPINGVHIFDMSGVLLQQIETDYSCNKLFTFPHSIAISPDQDALYITDRTEKTVVFLTMEGNLISKYSNDSLQEPTGVYVDGDGYVYVCSKQNSTFHRPSPCGQLVKIILEQKDGVKFPCAVAHSADTLCISGGSTAPAIANNLKLFSLHRPPCCDEGYRNLQTGDCLMKIGRNAERSGLY